MRQLLAIFLFFKFLPVPVNLDVLLVTSDDLVLDLICAFLAVLVLDIATIVFRFFGVLLNFCDHLRCVILGLLQEVCKKPHCQQRSPEENSNCFKRTYSLQ